MLLPLMSLIGRGLEVRWRLLRLLLWNSSERGLLVRITALPTTIATGVAWRVATATTAWSIATATTTSARVGRVRGWSRLGAGSSILAHVPGTEIFSYTLAILQYSQSREPRLKE